MPILLDHHLQEQIPHDILAFPIAFYCDELAALPNRTGPMHWHPYSSMTSEIRLRSVSFSGNVSRISIWRLRFQ